MNYESRPRTQARGLTRLQALSAALRTVSGNSSDEYTCTRGDGVPDIQQLLSAYTMRDHCHASSLLCRPEHAQCAYAVLERKCQEQRGRQ